MSSNLKNAIRIAKRGGRITPKLHGYLNRAPSGVHIANDEVWEQISTVMRPSATTHDRSGVFHPSQLYQCQRRQVFEYYGLEQQQRFNPTLSNLFNDGHFRHLRWQIMLLNAGIITDIEVKVSLPDQRIAGSMDGANLDEGWMFELKGTSQFRTVQDRGAMAAHIKQVNAYLLMSGLETAVIVYECKSTQQWLEIEINRDPTVTAEIEDILAKLNDAIDTGDLPEVLDDCKHQKGPTFNNCPYADRCLGISASEDIVALLPARRRAANRK